MRFGKRVFDLVLGSLLALIMAPLFIAVLVIVLIREGRPVFYGSERMHGPSTGFCMWKIRTITHAAQKDGVAGGHSTIRITTTGRWLRKQRLDELPQLWNVLRGEMSLVGPRPPLRDHVARFPVLYQEVLQTRPGLTGLGTLKFVHHEARLLSRGLTAAQSDEIYVKLCIRHKAKFDLIYHKHQSLWLDLRVLWQTTLSFFCGFRR